MSIRPIDELTNVDPVSADYPNGEYRNDTVTGDKTGTPLVASTFNDMQGFTDALLADAGIIPGGTPDTALSSDRLRAIRKTTMRKISSIYDPAFANLQEGDIAELVEYHPNSGVGGGRVVVKLTLHDGITAFSKTRERPTFGNPSEELAWYTVGTDPELCAVRLDVEIDTHMAGARNSGSDDYYALFSLLALDVPVNFYTLEYLTSGELVRTSTAHVNWNNCTINGSLITDTGVSRVLSIEGDDTLAQLPALATSLVFADRNLTFNSAHNLSVDDWVVIYDPRDYSYSPARIGYKAGEFLQVKEIVSTTEVVISGTVFSRTGYDAAECELYKTNKTKFSFDGSLTVKTPEIGSNIRAISLSNAINTDISNFTGIAKESVIGIVISQSINISGNNIVADQSGDVAVDYGLAVVSSQHVKLRGKYTARRHGVTTAEQNYGDVGVVCRDIHFDGYFASYDPDLASADTHGNSEHVLFTGVIDGGVNLRGNLHKCLAKVYADASGRCVQFSELTGYDFDISGSTLYGSKLDSAWGIISSGYSGTAAANDYTETVGGLLNLSNVTIDAPNATLLVSILKKASDATDVKIDLRGLNVVNSQSSPEITFVDSSPSGNFELLNLEGIKGLGADLVLTHTKVNKVIAKVIGQTNITTDGDNRAQLTIPLGISFGTTYTPAVYSTLGTSGNVATSSGDSFIIPYGVPTGAANSQAIIGFGSANNDNMNTSQVRKVNWIAE